MNCPNCGKKLTIKPKPGEPGRVIGLCDCNPIGPVYVGNAPVKKQKETK